jgi:hypothetical protein
MDLFLPSRDVEKKDEEEGGCNYWEFVLMAWVIGLVAYNS